MYFAVCVTPKPDTVIALSGELDLAAVPVFEAALQKLELRSVRGVVLDLRRLSFIDGAGLHAVLDLLEECLKVSTPLSIVPGPRSVQRVFAITGADRLLPWSGPADGRDRAFGLGSDTRGFDRFDTAAPRQEPRRKRSRGDNDGS